MPTVSRTRTRPYGPSAMSGSKTRSSQFFSGGLPFGSPSVSVATSSRLMGNEVCQDRLSLSSPYPDNDLTLKKTYFKSWFSMSGTVKQLDQDPYLGSNVTEKLHNYTGSFFSSPYSSGLPLLTAPNFSYYETRAIAQFNATYSPLVDVPLFLFELREFPRLLYGLGTFLRRGAQGVHISDVPGGYLAEKFGWAPLLSDVFKMMSLASEVDKRLNKLSDARAGRRVTGTLADSSDKTNGDRVNVYQLGLNKLVTVDQFITRAERAWFVATPKVTDLTDVNALISAYQARSVRAWLLLYGLERVSAATLWDAIPWSWLIDYFSTLGDFIEASGNTFPAVLTNLNIMVHQTLSVTTSTVVNTAGLVVSKGHFLRDHKYRRVVLLPTAKITSTPILTFGQTAVIDSLFFAAALKRLK